jgi:uncharacterized membrane protein YdjX (TVP38/TMEM64 family)
MIEQERAMRNEQKIQRPTSFAWKRIVPVAIVVTGIALFFALGLNRYLTFETLKLHRNELMAYVALHPLQAVMLFVAVYAGATALSLPGGSVLTLTGGFLFGIWIGAAAVIFGATIGATILFILARTVLGDVLRERAGPFVKKMEAGFKENALSYLLVLRLIPAFPFFIVNLVPAFLGVPLATFVIGTFLGIIPGTFVFASVGAGLGSIFDRMEEVSLTGALTPEVITALCGLAILSLIPVIYKKLRSARSSNH